MAENPYPWLDPSQQPPQGGGFQWPFGWFGGGTPAAPAAPGGGDSDLRDRFQASLGQGGPNSTAAPASQPYILIDLPKGAVVPPGVQAVDANGNPLPNPPGKIWINNPGFPVAQQATTDRAAATAAATAAAKANEPKIIGSRIYVPDKNGDWNAVTPETPDDIKKFAEIQQREYNKALTGRYMTDEESIDYQAKLNKLGDDKVAQARLQAEFEQKARAAEQEFKQKATLFPISVEQAGANVANTRATTAATAANTQATLQNIDVQRAKLPGELEQQGLTAEGTRLSNQQAQQNIRQGNAPKVAPAPTGMNIWQTDPNTGALTPQGVNPEYLPKTMPEVYARIGQINNAMQAKSREVQAKVGQIIDGKQYTNEDAFREYNQWHDQQVAPQAGAIQAAQQAALFAQVKDETEMRRNALQTALNAGTNYTNAAQTEMTHRVGPGFQQAMNQIASGQGRNVDLGSAIGYRGPSVTQGAEAAVHNALKDISPGAAAAVGAPLPNFQGIDINAALAPTRWMPGGGAPMAPPAPPPPTPPVPNPNQMLDGGTGWQRADQMWGGALPGNQQGNTFGMPAGWVDPNSPVALVNFANAIPDFQYGGG